MMSISASGRLEGMAGLSFALALLASGACARDEPEIYRAAVPFLIILGFGVLLITYVPQLTTGLLTILGRT